MVDAVQSSLEHGSFQVFRGLPRNLRGAVWMLAASILFTAMAVLIKKLGADYPPALQTFYRQLAGFVVLLPVVVRMRGRAYRTNRLKTMVMRTSFNILATILAYYAYQKLSLAYANALSFTRGLWMVPLAAFVVREHVGSLRIAAALVGFSGVIVMLYPDLRHGLAFGVPAMAMLLSALLNALGIIGMKVLSKDHSPTVLLVWAMTLGLLFSLPGAFLYWRTPTMSDLMLLSLMGVIGTATQACYIRGMHAGDAALMSQVDYLRLVFTALAGFLFFQELPTAWTVGGATIIVLSTLFITWREQARARLSRMRVAPDALLAD